MSRRTAIIWCDLNSMVRLAQPAVSVHSSLILLHAPMHSFRQLQIDKPSIWSSPLQSKPGQSYCCSLTSRQSVCHKSFTNSAHLRMSGSVTLGRKPSGSAEKSSGVTSSKSLPGTKLKFWDRNWYREALLGNPLASVGRVRKLALTAAASRSNGKSLQQGSIYSWPMVDLSSVGL